jgi:hypothetical protein
LIAFRHPDRLAAQDFRRARAWTAVRPPAVVGVDDMDDTDGASGVRTGVREVPANQLPKPGWA